jgi:hypothetical protein
MFMWKEISEGVCLIGYISGDITVAGSVGHLSTLQVRLSGSPHMEIT